MQYKKAKNHNIGAIKCDFEILPNIKIYAFTKRYRVFFRQKVKLNKHLLLLLKLNYIIYMHISHTHTHTHTHTYTHTHTHIFHLDQNSSLSLFYSFSFIVLSLFDCLLGVIFSGFESNYKSISELNTRI